MIIVTIGVPFSLAMSSPSRASMPFCRSSCSDWSSSMRSFRSLLPHHIPRRIVCGRGCPRPKTGFSFCWLYQGLSLKYSFSTSTNCCCFFSSLCVSLVCAVRLVSFRSIADGRSIAERSLLALFFVPARLYGVSRRDVGILAMLLAVPEPRIGRGGGR